MNVTGPNSSIPSFPISPLVTQTAKRSTPTSTPTNTGASTPASTSATAQSDAPAGMEPALWRVLTSEEKQFFQQSSNLGPLTYGGRATQQATPQAPVGQRIDVMA